MLVNMKEMLTTAKVNKCAIAQFNINNLEWSRFVLEACQTLSSPVILGVSEGAINYMGGYNTVVCMIEGLIADLGITIDVVIHLDHGSSYESCKKAVDCGFTSVMIDASRYDLAKNIEITKEVVLYAHSHGVSVEAEVGAIGGTEDGISSELAYAKVEDAIKMVDESGIDFLAPALGSVHGLYDGEPNLDFDRMKEISEKTGVPLVLHGGSGIGDDLIVKAISCGISKINLNTELQIVWNMDVRTYLIENPEVYDPRKVIKSGEKALKDLVIEKIRLFNNGI